MDPEGILNWLNQRDVLTAQHARSFDAFAKRAPGTGQWLFKHPKWDEFMKSKDSILWVHGKGGCGKTILAISIIEHIAELYTDPADNFCLAPFYFSMEDARSQLMSPLVQTLLFRVSHMTYFPTEVGEFALKHRYDDPTAKLLTLCFEETLMRIKNVTLVIDGVNECAERTEFLRWLEHLKSAVGPKTTLRIVCLSRDEPDIAASLKEMDALTLAVEDEYVQEDIKLYLTNEFDQDEKLRALDPEVKEKAINSLLCKSQGRFLWTSHQVEAFKAQNDLALVESPPSTLYETYDLALKRIPEDSASQAASVLQWMASSACALSLGELAVASALDPQTSPVFQPDRKIPSAKIPVWLSILASISIRTEDDETRVSLASILHTCPNSTSLVDAKLALLQEEEEILADPNCNYAVFAHLTVKEYLLSSHLKNQKELALFCLDREHGDEHLALSCVAYINYCAEFVKEKPDEPIASFPLLAYAEAFVFHHLYKIRRSLSAATWHPKLVQFCKAAETLSTSSLPSTFEHFHHQKPTSSLHFAVRLGIPAVVISLIDSGADASVTAAAAFGEAPPLLVASDLGFCEIAGILIQHGADIHKNHFEHGTALNAAAIKGNVDVMRLLLSKGAQSDEIAFSYNSSPLHGAVRNGQTEAVELLLENGEDIDQPNEHQETPLQYAAEHNDLQTVRLLIRKGAKLKIPTEESEDGFELPLLGASRRGFTGIVVELLNAGASIDARDDLGAGILELAALSNSPELVATLINANADVNAVGELDTPVLTRAAEKSSSKVVKLLLDAGADIHAHGGLFGTALHAASAEGSPETIKLLVDAGADVDSTVGLYNTPLQTASYTERSHNVRALLDAGANVNVAGGTNHTALQAAASQGHHEIVTMLLDAGADVKLAGGDHCTALHAACKYAPPETVRLLLDNGADVNKSGGIFYTPLFAACNRFRDDTDTFQMLLDAGADINVQKGEWGTPLQVACTTVNSEIVQVLLDAGANVKLEGGETGSALKAALLGRMASINAEDTLKKVELLLQHGADINSEGGQEGSPLRIATDKEMPEVVELLQKHGATMSGEPFCWDPDSRPVPMDAEFSLRARVEDMSRRMQAFSTSAGRRWYEQDDDDEHEANE